MSREDPQFKLRMSPELRAKAEQSAKSAGRSLNAELVSRIEASYLGCHDDQNLLPAARAKQLALIARSRLPEELRRRAAEAIARAIQRGHNEAIAKLDDLCIDYGIPEKEADRLIEGIKKELAALGYNVKNDDISSLWIEF